jgi:hypothetical protein
VERKISDLISKIVGWFASLLLARMHPLGYVGLYVASLVGFGFAYMRCPAGFYAPYARYEPGLLRDKAELASTLEKAFQTEARRAAARDQNPPRQDSDYRLRPDKLRVLDASSIDDTHLTFTVAYFVRPLRGRTEFAIPLLTVTVPEGPTDTFPDHMTARDVVLRSLPISEEGKRQAQAAAATLFFQRNSDYPGTLMLGEDEEVELEHYFRGFRGDPLSSTGQLARMMYLSAVVITTLGLGDIVPITPLARFLVGSEAFLGVTIAGYFLTAIANHARARP